MYADSATDDSERTERDESVFFPSTFLAFTLPSVVCLVVTLATALSLNSLLSFRREPLAWTTPVGLSRTHFVLSCTPRLVAYCVDVDAFNISHAMGSGIKRQGCVRKQFL